MVLLGFPSEARGLMDRGYDPSLPSMSSIGYREMCAHVRGECDLATAIERTKVETHRLIRRQANWFRSSDERIAWIEQCEPGRAFELAMRHIEGARG
jgi:tRNA dimethylallyltransferase